MRHPIQKCLFALAGPLARSRWQLLNFLQAKRLNFSSLAFPVLKVTHYPIIFHQIKPTHECVCVEARGQCPQIFVAITLPTEPSPQASQGFWLLSLVYLFPFSPSPPIPTPLTENSRKEYQTHLGFFACLFFNIWNVFNKWAGYLED